MNGVRLGMWRPAGWETDQSSGLVLAEHNDSANGSIPGGLLVYCFVPPPDEFDVTTADHPNFAWAVLDRVVKMPSHTGSDVAVSQPAGFEWDDHEAAYYLLTTGDGVRMLVLALTVPDQQKVVVCSISVPVAQTERIRTLLPKLLDGLTVEGSVLDGAALDALPNPLPFPRYNLALNNADNRIASNNPP